MARRVDTSELTILRAAVTMLIREYGEATGDWKYATIKVPDTLIAECKNRSLVWNRDYVSYTWNVSAPLEPERAPEPLNSVCKNCGKKIYKFVQESSVWFHVNTKLSECSRPVDSGTRVY